MELDQRSYGGDRGGANNKISYIVPQGEDAGLSSVRVPSKGRDADGDEGPFLATACQGRRDHLEGG